MKKFVKMSLVAAVAVAGLTSTVSAKDLSEAIKGVDVSGQFRYRMEDKNIEASGATSGTNSNYTDVEVEIGVKVPVTDMVTAVFKIDNAGNKTNADASTKGDVEIEDYYFSYSNAGATVNFGQQNIPGRLTDGAQGSGLVALYTANGITAGAAAFINNTLTTEEDVLSVLASGTVGPVSLSAQYVDVTKTADTFHLKADATFDMLTVGAEYSETELDANKTSEYETTKIYVAGSIDALSITATYASTGKAGAGSLHAATANAGAAETPAEFLLWQVGSFDKAELDIFALDATYSINDKFSLRAAYADGDYTAAGTDITETLGQVNYKVASNLNTYLRVSKKEDGTTDTTRGRVEVRYSF